MCLFFFSQNIRILRFSSFRWTQFQISAICREVSEHGVRVALKNNASKLEDIYSERLTAIERQNTADAAHGKAILTWMLYAYQPITGDELLEALSVDLKTANFRAIELPVTRIVDICQGLVEFDPKMSVFRFPHFSLVAFLFRHFPPEAAHSSLAKVCLTLLTHHHTASCHEHLAPSLILEYSRANWIKHVQSSAIGRNLVRYCYSFFENSIVFEDWYSHRPNDSIYPDRPDVPVLLAPHLGLWNIFEYEVDAGTDVNSCDSNGLTALHVAVRNVDLDGLSWLLIQRGIHVDQIDKDGRTALSWAAGAGSEDIVERLLKNVEINVDRTDNNGRTALSWAAGSGSVEIVNLLLKKGVDLDHKDNNGRAAMGWAAEQGHDKVVELFKVALSK